MKNGAKVALTGVISALAVVVMLLTALPTMQIGLPVVAGALLIVPVVECGVRWGVTGYAATAILSLLLAPSMESKLLFLLFFGYYPVIKAPIERLRAKPLRVFLKLLLFNAAVCVMYGILFLTMGGEALMREMVENGWFLTALMLVMGNAAMLLYDWMLERLLMTYMARRPGAKKR